MPSTYDREKALPLRVPAELRARLDAIATRLPPGLSLPRNSIAVAALALGVAELGARLDADPVAVHRALAAAAGGDAGVRPGAPAPLEGAAPAAPATEAPRTSPRRAAARSPSRDTGGTASRAASPKPSRTRAPASPVEGDGPGAPTAAMVRELLATVLRPDGDARGWTVKGLAAALECDRRAVQVFRDGGTGMGRRLQLRAWSLLRGPAPSTPVDPG